jgi:outer membrane lipoprotein SlyB
MKKQFVIVASIVVAAAAISGCASPNYYAPAASQLYPAPSQSYSQPYPEPYSQPSAASPRTYSRYGVVNSIQALQTNDRNSNGTGIGAGAVLGGVVGGLIGNQVGGGRGRTAATVAGAIGGVMVGNQIEQSNNVQARNMYQIGILLDDGTYQNITQDNISDLRVGNRVRIEDERVYRY